MTNSIPSALIVGVGSGLSASLVRLLTREGYGLHLAARDMAKLGDLSAETGAVIHETDGSDPAQVAALFEAIDGPLNVVIYNPSARAANRLKRSFCAGFEGARSCDG